MLKALHHTPRWTSKLRNILMVKMSFSRSICKYCGEKTADTCAMLQGLEIEHRRLVSDADGVELVPSSSDLEDPSSKTLSRDRGFIASLAHTYTRAGGIRVAMYALAAMSVITFVLFGSPFFLFFSSEKGFYPQWAAMRAHLSDLNDPAVVRIRSQLHFYDLTMDYVLSFEGLFYILYWNMWRRYCVGPLCPHSTVFSATETNHGLSMWYFKPYVRGDPKYRNPTKWIFTGLNSSPFPKAMMQESVDILKAAAPKIKKEYLEKVAAKLTMHPDQRTEIEKGGSWDWNFLYGTTGKNDEVCDRVPETTEVVHSLPTVYNYGFCFFSRLKPGTHIMPHTGSTNLRIRLHLGLVIPTEPDYTATIRVGTEQQAWVQDDVLVFDDAYEHEVVYEGKTERAVFIIDLWHPELTEKERELLNYGGFGPFGTQGSVMRQLD